MKVLGSCIGLSPSSHVPFLDSDLPMSWALYERDVTSPNRFRLMCKFGLTM
jgi:hypothetical protein